MNIKEETILSNRKNYKDTFDTSNCLVYQKKYMEIVNAYLEYAVEHINIRNSVYFSFVIHRGLTSIFHIFNIVFLYTKNIDLTLMHCKKALYYYIEFIGQIGDESHSYLQLNSKDATLFIYKKTIFEIDGEHRKQFVLDDKEKHLLNTLTTINTIANELLLFILQEKGPLDIIKKEITINYTIQHTKKLLQRLLNKKYFSSLSDETLMMVLFFIRFIQLQNLSLERFLEVCEMFFKKLHKKKLTTKQLKSKLYNPKNTIFQDKLGVVKYINWLFAH